MSNAAHLLCTQPLPKSGVCGISSSPSPSRALSQSSYLPSQTLVLVQDAYLPARHFPHQILTERSCHLHLLSTSPSRSPHVEIKIDRPTAGICPGPTRSEICVTPESPPPYPAAWESVLHPSRAPCASGPIPPSWIWLVVSCRGCVDGWMCLFPGFLMRRSRRGRRSFCVGFRLLPSMGHQQSPCMSFQINAL